jgi:hypothetical protein
MKMALPGELSTVAPPIRQSTSHWFEFESEANQDSSLNRLDQINRELLAKIKAMDSSWPAVVHLDTEAPVDGEKDLSPYNGHVDSTSRQLLLRFGGEDDCLVANLQPEKAPSVKDFAGQPEATMEVGFRGTDAFAKPEICDVTEESGVLAVVTELPTLSKPAGTTITTPRQLKRSDLRKPWWKLLVAAVVIALVITGWIAHNDRRPASPLGAVLQKSKAPEQQEPFVSEKPPENSTSKPQTAPVAMVVAKAARRHHRVQVEENRVRLGENEVDIGKDVTVRYFSPPSGVVPPTGATSSPSQATDRSSPEPQTSISPKPPK